MDQNTLGLEKEIFEEFVGLKNAYALGRDEFVNQYNSIKPELLLQLSHDAGMAKMYKQKKELLNYSIHSYKIVERIFSELFDMGTLSEEARKTRLKYFSLRIDWHEYLQVKHYEFYADKENLFLSEKDNPNNRFKFIKGQEIGRTTPRFWDFKSNTVHIRSTSGEIITIDDCTKDIIIEVIDVNRKKSMKFRDFYSKLCQEITFNQDGKKAVRLNFPQQEFIFKHLTVFDGSNKKMSAFAQHLNQERKLYLNALVFMRFFRNLGSHNTVDNQSLEEKYEKLKSGDRAEHGYLSNPESILKTDYFERYIDFIMKGYMHIIQNI